MRHVWLAVVACGCNSIFGISTANEHNLDAQLFDRPPDAPFACPSLGTAPTFDRGLRQLEVDQTYGYVESETGTALALCRDIGGDRILCGGPAGGPLAAAPLDPALATALSAEVQPPRLAPEGNFAIVQVLVQTPSEAFVPLAISFDGAAQTWKLDGTIVTGIPTTSYISYSTPTRGSPRHMIAISAGLGMVYELVGDATSWTIADQYAFATFSASTLNTEEALTPDGLRMLLPLGGSGNGGPIYYTDRSDVSSRFGAPMLLDTPEVNYPVLTEDCSRLYFNALETELYFEQ